MVGSTRSGSSSRLTGGSRTARSRNEIVYLAADEEEEFVVAQANAPIDDKGRFVNDRILVRRSPQAATLQGLSAQLEQEVFFGATTEISSVPPEEVQLMDVSPRQIVSVATALIPFLEHDDANRALMGANMQRQAVPLVRAEAPYIGTGIELRAAHDAADMIIAEDDGAIADVDGTSITVEYKKLGKVIYRLLKFERSNQDTCINQRPIVVVGDKVKTGDILADGPSTDLGELALGKNLLVAFMPWKGYNFEDAIILSERLVKTTCSPRSTFTSTRSTLATPSSGPKRSPGTSRTSPRRSSPTSTNAASSASAPRSRPVMCSLARSRRRAKPSSPPKSGYFARSSVRRPAKSETPR